jgi:hypothetical protein
MARLRRRPVRQEPIRAVDAVVVARGEAEVPAEARRAPRGEGSRAGVRPIDTSSGSPTAGQDSIERPNVRVTLTDDQGQLPKGDGPVAPELTPARWIEPVADADDVQESLHPVPSTSEGAGVEEAQPAPKPAPPDPVVLAHAATEAYREPAIYDDGADLYFEEEVDEPAPATVDGTTCRIAVWRGYRKATFYAQAFDSRGGEVALAESPSFRYSGNGMPEQTQAAAEAHRALLEALRHSGYQTAKRGTSWFDMTLTRR